MQSSVGDAGEGSRPQRIPIHPNLYKAAVEGDINVFKEYLKSQEFQQQLDGVNSLGGVTIGNNTLLHIVATSCNQRRSAARQPISSYIEFAKEVHSRNRSLLMARNKLMETPLHCAVKTGNYTMTSLLISLGEYEHQVKMEALLTATNLHGETVLHEAVRIGHRDLVNKLILSEPRLTSIVDAEGISPLYLASMINAFEIVQVFTREEPSLVSCAGPKGQTALHAAVLVHSGITSELLKWDESLATKLDDSGSSPLHYAVSAGNLATVKLILQLGTSASYIADKKGLYPIHIAANGGNALVIKELIEKVPDSDELLDKDGRNFLHIAIMGGQQFMIHIPQNPTFLRMLNSMDYEGNTPLHIASQRGEYHIVRFLLSTELVWSSTMNRNGLTPVDLSMTKMDRGLRYLLNKQFNILRCLLWTGALPSPRRVDHLVNDSIIPVKDRLNDIRKLESIARNLVITSALIATVTFAAVFTLPGGYIADDHVNKGTPILYKKYAFKAFLAADLMAFILSIIATSWLIYAGSANIDLELRSFCLCSSVPMVNVGVKATVCAFALAIYTLLSPVNLPISIVICVAIFILLVISDPSHLECLYLVQPVAKQLGCTGLFKSRFRPPTWKRVTGGVGYDFISFFWFGILEYLFLYGTIFLLALI